MFIVFRLGELGLLRASVGCSGGWVVLVSGTFFVLVMNGGADGVGDSGGESFSAAQLVVVVTSNGYDFGGVVVMVEMDGSAC